MEIIADRHYDKKMYQIQIAAMPLDVGLKRSVSRKCSHILTLLTLKKHAG